MMRQQLIEAACCLYGLWGGAWLSWLRGLIFAGIAPQHLYISFTTHSVQLELLYNFTLIIDPLEDEGGGRACLR